MSSPRSAPRSTTSSTSRAIAICCGTTPTCPPARQAFGASFDDNWSGGWDELLPNDLPRPAPDGDMLPDHGEVWSQEAEWEVLEDRPRRCAARFTTYGRVLPPPSRRCSSLLRRRSLPAHPLHLHQPCARTPSTSCGTSIRPWRSPSTHAWTSRQTAASPTHGETRFKGNTAFTWPYAGRPRRPEGRLAPWWTLPTPASRTCTTSSTSAKAGTRPPIRPPGSASRWRSRVRSSPMCGSSGRSGVGAGCTP